MTVTVIPLVVGALCTNPKGLAKRLKDLEIGGQVETIQTTALSRLARILRILNNEKWKITKGIQQPIQERIRMLGDNGNLRYSVILEANTIKQAEMKKKTKQPHPKKKNRIP